VAILDFPMQIETIGIFNRSIGVFGDNCIDEEIISI